MNPYYEARGLKQKSRLSTNGHPVPYRYLNVMANQWQNGTYDHGGPHGVGPGCMDSSQITASRGNPAYVHKLDSDRGGPFWTSKYWFSTRFGGVPVSLTDFPKHTYYFYRVGQGEGFITFPLLPLPLYTRSVIPTSHNDGYYNWLPSSPEFLEAWGAKAVEACKPTRTANSLYVSLKELKQDGLPKMISFSVWEEKTRALRNAAGSEYLNYQFGWLPLVNDIRKFYDTASQFEKIWSQYERDAGKPVHRRFKSDPVEEFVEDYPSTTQNLSISGPFSDFSFNSKGRTLIRQVKKTRRMWFSGSFEYYLPSRGDMTQLASLRRQLARLNKLLGVVPTPDMIWSATPWTWALDWFSNAGSVISNLSDTLANGLVMPYGYAMEHTKTETLVSSVGGTIFVGPQKRGPAPVLRICVVQETKQRVQASPYGFGLTWSGFSPQQLSILASLGVTRGR